MMSDRDVLYQIGRGRTSSSFKSSTLNNFDRRGCPMILMDEGVLLRLTRSSKIASNSGLTLFRKIGEMVTELTDRMLGLGRTSTDLAAACDRSDDESVGASETSRSGKKLSLIHI